MDLLNQQEKIYKYANRTYNLHNREIKRINTELTKPDLTKLEKDQLDSLCELFFSNFGQETFDTLSRIYYTIDSYIYWMTKKEGINLPPVTDLPKLLIIPFDIKPLIDLRENYNVRHIH